MSTTKAEPKTRGSSLLLRYMRKNELNQTELVAKLNRTRIGVRIANSTLYQLLAGNRGPSLRVACAIEEIAGIHPSAWLKTKAGAYVPFEGRA